MNHECFVLADAKAPLEVESGLVRDVLEMLFHHILFHRALGGEVVAKECVLLDDLFYVQCDDAKIKNTVTVSAANAAAALEKQMNKTGGAGKVSLTFFETVSGGIWGERKVPWEEWVLHVRARTKPAFGQQEEMLRRKELEGRLKTLMWQVRRRLSCPCVLGPSELRCLGGCPPLPHCAALPGLRSHPAADGVCTLQIHGIVNLRRSHLPKVNISSSGGSPLCFPFEIKDPSAKQGVLDLLGRAVSSGPKVQVPL
uniref:Autophagy-related protein 101 n=2 Tax=Hemiselmis andersenii TaxID=464988 RepID=A0A7S1EC79_HEMAN|mmetsp:Transcript_42247/g.103171  ORF Transcript_42247/g.103171 Transcript_42247/m.103171 type:complete len:255 (+) Transcript_42247:68-832(+)